MPQPDQNLADGPLAGAADSGAAADEKVGAALPASWLVLPVRLRQLILTVTRHSSHAR